MSKKFIRKLIDVEIKLGFLHIPAAGIEMMPGKDGKIAVVIDGKDNELTYNASINAFLALFVGTRQTIPG